MYYKQKHASVKVYKAIRNSIANYNMRPKTLWLEDCFYCMVLGIFHNFIYFIAWYLVYFTTLFILLHGTWYISQLYLFYCMVLGIFHNFIYFIAWYLVYFTTLFILLHDTWYISQLYLFYCMVLGIFHNFI